MRPLPILVAALALGAAGLAQDVNYNFAKDADFSGFKTYKWVDIKGGEQLDQITANQLRSAIEEELATKGLKRTDSDNADLYIGYQVALNHEKEITSYNTGWGYGPGWGAWGAPGISTAQTSTILIGTLALDMYDAANKKLVWRGTATKTIDPNVKPEKREKNIKKAVAKLLKNYPPKVAS